MNHVLAVGILPRLTEVCSHDRWLTLAVNVILLVSNSPAEPRRIMGQDSYVPKRRMRENLKRQELRHSRLVDFVNRCNHSLVNHKELDILKRSGT